MLGALKGLQGILWGFRSETLRGPEKGARKLVEGTGKWPIREK